MKRKVVQLLLAVMVAGSIAGCGASTTVPMDKSVDEILSEESGESMSTITDAVQHAAGKIKDSVKFKDRVQVTKYVPLITELSKYTQFGWQVADVSPTEFLQSLNEDFYNRFEALYDTYQDEVASLLSDSEETGRTRLYFSGKAVTGYEGYTLKGFIEDMRGIEYSTTDVRNGEVIVTYIDGDGINYNCVVVGTGLEEDGDRFGITDYNTGWQISYVESYSGEKSFETDLHEFFKDLYDYTDNERFEALISEDTNYNPDLAAEEGTADWWRNKSIEDYWKWSAPFDTEEQHDYFKEYSHRKMFDNFEYCGSVIGFLPSDIVDYDKMSLVMGGTTSGYEQEGFLISNDKFIYIVVPYVENNNEELPIVYAEELKVSRDNLADWFKKTPYVVDSAEVIEPGKAVIRMNLLFDTSAFVTIHYPTNFAEAPEYIDQLNFLARFNTTYIIMDDKISVFEDHWEGLVDKLFSKTELDFVYDSYARWENDSDYEEQYIFGIEGYRGNYLAADFDGLSEIMAGQPR